MEVNSLLCVGRGRLSQFGKTHSSESGVHTPERKSSTEMNNGAGLTEKDLVARVSSKLSQDSLSPPTKSILRGRIPSPKQGSPSSLRSVRFSDRGDDDVMYAKIHVNKNIQTEHIHKEKMHKEPRSGHDFKLDLAQTHEEFNPKVVSELKTSTPRYNLFEEPPSLDFHTPRGHQEDRKTLQKSPIRDTVSVQVKRNANHKENTQKSENKHERIIFDIDIEHKRPGQRETSEYKSESKVKRNMQGQRGPASGTTDNERGNKIIQNMDINRSQSKSPERKRPIIPDGNRIIQNLELSCGDVTEKMRSTASQTSCSDTSSPRSASPETPFENIDIPDGRRIIKNMEFNSADCKTTKSSQTNLIPDGDKIIQNLELSSRDSSFKSKSESSQTFDMDLTDAQRSNRPISVGIQAFGEDDTEEENFRSVLVQTDLNDSDDDSHNESFDLSNVRSIAVQTQAANEPTIPDGSQITKNMELHKSDKSKQSTDIRDEKKTLNDSNWNEFVRHLELFNPSQSSSSSASVSEEEIPTSQIAEPILVYDRSAPSPESVKKTVNISPEGKLAQTQEISERNARTFLKSDAYTKHQYESILRDEGLLSKYDIGIKSTESPSLSAKELVEKAFTKNKEEFKRTKISPKEESNGPAFSMRNIEQLRNQQQHRPEQTPVSTYCKDFKTTTSLSSGIYVKSHDDQKHAKSDKENLGFTPIETYSFNPETLMKTAAKRACSSSKPITKPLKPSISPTFGTKESVTKNSFIQGLDLGPVPKPLPSKRSPSLSSACMSDGAGTSLYRHDSLNDRSFGYRYDGKYGKDFSERSNYQGSTSLATPSLYSKSVSGYQQPGYSHVTGHQPRTSFPNNRFSISQNRPSSAPTTSSRSYPGSLQLSSTLREMRNNALRKNAMHQYSDQKRRSPALVKSTSFSVSANNTRAANYTKSSKFSMSDYSRSSSVQSYLGSTSGHKSLARNANLVKERSSSPRRASPQRSDYMYLSALNDQSNVRPPSRERSRSRSPAQSPTTEYRKSQSDSTYHSNHQKANTCSTMAYSSRHYDEIKQIIGKEEDNGNFDSVISSGYQRSCVSTSSNNVENTTSRESRPLARKPPLPRSRKSLSNGRSRSRSSDSLTRENLKQPKDVKKQNQRDDIIGSAKNGSINREIKHKLDKPGRDLNTSELRTVSIGNVPSGLADPGCMFLGHDTIQKIIEEAKL